MPPITENEEEGFRFRSRSGATAGENKRNIITAVVLPPPSRSMSMSHPASVPVKIGKRNTLRRKSMSYIKQNTGDIGTSKEFQLAMKKDASHEVHPAWNSVRKLAGVVGYVHFCVIFIVTCLFFIVKYKSYERELRRLIMTRLQRLQYADKFQCNCTNNMCYSEMM